MGATSRGLLLRGVGGSRFVSAEPFLLGPAAAVCVEPFNLLGLVAGLVSTEQFWVFGPASSVCVEPFNVLGFVSNVSAEPFEVLDGTVGVFDEGGIVLPLLGVWEPD